MPPVFGNPGHGEPQPPNYGHDYEDDDEPHGGEVEDEDSYFDETSSHGSARGSELFPPAAHLPPPPEIHGSAGYSEIGGVTASTVVGRSTSAPLFTQAAGHEVAAQLRVFRIDEGVAASLGTLPIGAREEDLVRVFFQSMPLPGDGRKQFYLRPLDAAGGELGLQTSVWIADDHRSLQAIRRRQVGSYGGMGWGGFPPRMLPSQSPAPPTDGGMMHDGMAFFRSVVENQQVSLAEERARIRDQERQTADERMAVAADANTTMQSLTERVLESDALRTERAREAEQAQQRRAAEAQHQIYQTQAEMLRQDKEAALRRADAEAQARDAYAQQQMTAQEQKAERERQEYERRVVAEQRAHDRRMEEMRMEMQQKELAAKQRSEQERIERIERAAAEATAQERKERLEREERAAREAQRQREHESAMARMKLDAEQQREHAERQMQLAQAQQAAMLAQAQGKAGDFTSILQSAVAALALVGMEPKDVIEWFRNRNAGEEDAAASSQWVTLAGQVMGTVGEVAKAKMIADAHKSSAIPAARARQRPPRHPLPVEVDWEDQEIDDDDGKDYEEAPAQRPDVRGAGPAPVPALPQGRPLLETRAGEPEEAPLSPVRARMLARRQGLGGPLPAQPAQSAPAAPVTQAQGPRVPLDVMPLAAQANAVAAIGALATQMRQADESTWPVLLGVALTGEPAIFPYVQHVTVTTALMEATRGDQGFVDRVVNKLRSDPRMPHDINFGGQPA